MAQMTVLLPDVMKDWVEARAKTGRYSDASEYLRVLIQRDQERADKIGEFQQLVTVGLESGVSDRSMKEVLETARRQSRDQL